VSPKIFENLLFRSRQMRYWLKMLAGESYHHKPQNLGKVFEPNKLSGYFNDLTGKILWTGEVDADGVPVNTLSNGRKLQFPISITQKALGHWDWWLIKKDNKDRRHFLTLCQWLLEHQDGSGGWDTWQNFLGPQYSKYSAMTQGQGLSVLSRALKLTDDSRFQQAAEKAFSLFLIGAEKGGVTCFDADAVFLEEAPSQPAYLEPACPKSRTAGRACPSGRPRNTVLNGWIFALFGLYDYKLATDEAKVAELFERSLDTLAQHLAGYDSGYWSYYDSQKRISSHFYHSLHISQLEALSLISENRIFEKYHRRWTDFENKFINRTRAFVVKAFQKLKEPARITIVK